MKKPGPRTDGQTGRDHAMVGEDLQGLFPHLTETLCSAKYDDGTPKGQGSLHIEPQQGRWKGRVKVVGSGLMLVLHASDPEALLVALEAALASEDCPWEDDPFGGVKKKKKKE